MAGIDHIYISVSDLARSEAFYDKVLVDLLGFRKNRFVLGEDQHIQYFDRFFGYVLRPTKADTRFDPYAPGLHHICLRVDSIEEVISIADRLSQAGIAATNAKCYPEYATDYWGTFFVDPDGIRLEVTNYRAERRERHDNWETLTSR
jgi:glyoxylase I family protein